MRLEPGRIAVVTGGANEAARIALAAVAARRPVAFTHPERVAEVEQRFAAIISGGRPG